MSRMCSSRVSPTSGFARRRDRLPQVGASGCSLFDDIPRLLCCCIPAMIVAAMVTGPGCAASTDSAPRVGRSWSPSRCVELRTLAAWAPDTLAAAAPAATALAIVPTWRGTSLRASPRVFFFVPDDKSTPDPTQRKVALEHLCPPSLLRDRGRTRQSGSGPSRRVHRGRTPSTMPSASCRRRAGHVFASDSLRLGIMSAISHVRATRPYP